MHCDAHNGSSEVYIGLDIERLKYSNSWSAVSFVLIEQSNYSDRTFINMDFIH